MSKDDAASTLVNAEALEPLFQPWEEPTAHRVKNPERGKPAIVKKHRRPSSIRIVQGLRSEVRQWRESFYVGATDTTRELLSHWFERPHRMTTPAGDEFEFRYFFCQREAIETFVYLKEVRRIDCLSQLIAAFGGPDAEIAALGVTEDEDAWSRYAFKLATGSGKTKVMSLAIVWSYFHALRESDSPMAKHFVVIAPNLTVYERLKEDFGDGRVFDNDPLIPPEWRGDWNMSIVLQDEASGAATGGTLYLTNIHRLYDNKAKRSKNSEMYDFAGPAVSKTTALDTGAALRDRITSHTRVMVLNDEAHHVWDPDSAWNEAISFLHNTIKSRTGGGLLAQLDFTATPKDDKGQLFKHVVCDAPLGEAVDGGVVKTPIIGKADKDLKEEPGDNAAYVFDRHLRLGYERWKRSRAEWMKSGKKALLFVMCENTDAADQIAQRFNTDEAFKELNGKTINLHTNLKGKIKKVGRGAKARLEFVENDKEISDDDLKELRKLSRELDENSSPYFCIVSVLMLREGWDVRNVTTIIPLRPYSAKSEILPEQTLGRGLRRMTPPGTQGAAEIVTVVEHPAFAALYQEQLAQEGLPIEIVDTDDVPSTTISIYPDEARKNLIELEIELPALTAGHRVLPKLEGLTLHDVRKAFARYKPLPLGTTGLTEIDYEGRHLFTGEVIERMKIDLPLLDSGVGAVSYFVKQIEQICKLRGLHQVLGPLVQTFLEEILFEQKTNLFDAKLVTRLGDSDVAEHLRAVFVPLVRQRTTTVEERTPAGEPTRLSQWRPFQVTHSERRPALDAPKTLFNLVPCNRELEVAFTKYADRAGDVAAFAKNAGPQCLRIDYLASGGRLAFYTPDFFVRTTDGRCYVVETKGRQDQDVPRKARAAIAWCESASTEGRPWEYLYVPQGVFERLRASTVRELANTCRPALQNVVDEDTLEAQFPLFAAIAEKHEAAPTTVGLVPDDVLAALPPRYRNAVEQAAMLFRFMENKVGLNFAPVFNALLGSLDEASKGLVTRRLQDLMPATAPEQKAWFEPYIGRVEGGKRRHYESMAQNLKRTLVFGNGISPLGLLRNCLDFALNDRSKFGGVFDAVIQQFNVRGGRDFLATVESINDFRNTHVAHQEQELTDAKLAERELVKWTNGLREIAGQ
ncbi:MAG: DEAD/DEAH box helicase family protein [Planctomycetes bacterium]|nr:DEAD/DEAH box helicase family protein [Planctomycetota bacterium]